MIKKAAKKKAAKKKTAKKKSVKKNATKKVATKGKRGGNRNNTPKAKAKKLKNQETALACRIAGLSYPKIAAHMGVSVGSAHAYVTDALAESAARIETNADNLRELELERLDKLIAGLWPKASNGSPSHVDKIVKVMEDRRKLAGIAPPPEVLGEMITDAKSDDGGVSVRVRFVKPE